MIHFIEKVTLTLRREGGEVVGQTAIEGRTFQGGGS